MRDEILGVGRGDPVRRGLFNVVDGGSLVVCSGAIVLWSASLHARGLHGGPLKQPVRRLKTSRRRSCSYDLTGNVGGVFPECGRAIARG